MHCYILILAFFISTVITVRSDDTAELPQSVKNCLKSMKPYKSRMDTYLEECSREQDENDEGETWKQCVDRKLNDRFGTGSFIENCKEAEKNLSPAQKHSQKLFQASL